MGVGLPAVAGVAALFLLLMVALIVIVMRTGSYIARLLLALLLVPPLLFCLYGFAATFEPLPASTQWTFRIGYTIIGLSLCVAILMLLWPKAKRDSEQ